MGSILAIVNQKGGVGKTTTVVNLAASLALGGRKILVVDSDPQCNSTSGLGIARESVERGIYDVYSERSSIGDVIVKTEVNFLHIIPSTIDLLAAEVELVGKEGREYILKNALKSIGDDFEYIFIDCPPSLGLLTLNALVAAEAVIVPVQCEYYSLEGLGLLTRTIKLVRNSFNPDLYIKGIVLTMFDSRNSLSHQVAREVRTHFGDIVFETVIPRNVVLGEAPSYGKPVLLYDYKSRGAQSYLALAKEMLHENGAGQRA
ncbi:sporulation initiation inhibitor protein Soj [bacterium BMS3Abin07]|nr:sporulation initiation inhibitor protein Soj [bacterium BMS3Abin07]GBE31364.1 sporulation initiation inhibitor protein Soj [bacterium BMS3Bbin05]HDL20310.1 ParA family protein [Nitrospirota bacterium]HDO22361.1 ParA family protein [Nitrospirota bacterium]HDZ88417.1 ParA family protein [Nitrospirota bacterium]